MTHPVGETMTSLAVYIDERRCGTLYEDKHGSLSFEYLLGYDGPALSLSMPKGLARYNDMVVRPYLQGLLPDSEEVRASIGQPHGISGNNPFRLLRLIGLDCPGAVQICTEETAPPSSSPEDLVPLTDFEIGERLAAVRENAANAWTDSPRIEEHWSLGGQQAKIALRLEKGRWLECKGASATTHILKPGVTGMEFQALVEYLSMKTAYKIGLPVAETEYCRFGEESAIVIKRYDRKRLEDGRVERIHQEDLCQALSVDPSAKYAEQGGPTTPRIIKLLRSTGANARENVYRFILYLFFNYLIGATDAHAKNHSLLLLADDDVRLAPLYDVASIAPYRSLKPQKRKPLRAALSIGGENRFGLAGRENVEKMVHDLGLNDLSLDANTLTRRFRTMAEVIPTALEEVIEAHGHLHGIDQVAPPMQSEIAAHCQRTIERLS